jgi:hypothetical protein
METLVFPLPKSPLPEKGRFGPREAQDWWRICEEAVRLAKEEYHYAPILVATGFVYASGIHEATFYQDVFTKEFHIPNVEVVAKGVETVGQLAAAFDFADRTSAELVVVSSVFHFPRVWWLCRGRKVRHRVVSGIPRLSEAIADIILAVLFPLIDLLGKRETWREKVERRRKEGKV